MLLNSDEEKVVWRGPPTSAPWSQMVFVPTSQPSPLSVILLVFLHSSPPKVLAAKPELVILDGDWRDGELGH